MNDAATLIDVDMVNVLSLPGEEIETPCFVVIESRVLHNLAITVAACGGPHRLMPHIKTHRAPWIVSLLGRQGIQAFKAATLGEVEMALTAGARYVAWAYPTVNQAHLDRFIGLARKAPNAKLDAIVDSELAVKFWASRMADLPANIRLRVDLDPGLGRTGVPMSGSALELARGLHALGRFAGWHIYDGHVKGSRADREMKVSALAEALASLQILAQREGINGDAIGGGSYTFDLWPESLVSFVSPGSWTYSSDQHDRELGEHGWKPAAFVLATVISTRSGTATLDAGSKAISPDKPLAERFRWYGRILLMNEEHTVVEASNLKIGEKVFLMPRHACTTAYLYDKALVRTSEGQWEYRSQLGSRR